jgi:hypothetical protein
MVPPLGVSLIKLASAWKCILYTKNSKLSNAVSLKQQGEATGRAKSLQQVADEPMLAYNRQESQPNFTTHFP